MVAKARIKIKLMLFFAITYYCINTIASESSSITHTLASLQYHLSLLTKKLPSSDPSKEEEQITSNIKTLIEKAKDLGQYETLESQLLYTTLKGKFSEDDIFNQIMQGAPLSTKQQQDIRNYWDNRNTSNNPIPQSSKESFTNLHQLIQQMSKKAQKGKWIFFYNKLINLMEILKGQFTIYTFEELKNKYPYTNKDTLVENLITQYLGLTPSISEQLKAYINGHNKDSDKPKQLEDLCATLNTSYIDELINIATFN